MITGKELFGEIKKKKSTFLCSLGEVFFSETSLGALWDHDMNDTSYMCAYPVKLSRILMLRPISNSSLLSHDSLGCYWLVCFFFFPVLELVLTSAAEGCCNNLAQNLFLKSTYCQ